MKIEDLKNLIICDNCGCVFDISIADQERGYYSRKLHAKCPACPNKVEIKE